MKVRNIVLIVFSLLALLMLSSCNWDVFAGEELEVVAGDIHNESASVLFTGAAPRNLRVSKAGYPDRITLSFSTVPHADFYRIYRAEVDSTFENNGVYDDSLYWELLETVDDTGGRSILYSDKKDLSPSANKAYLYCVQAGSDYAEVFLETFPEYSSVEMGWLLNPPETLSADQGIATDYIEITWSSVANVKGYNIEYSTDKIDWTNINPRRIPPVSINGKNSFFYYPPEGEYGQTLYFRVVSVQSNSESEASVTRTGYTFVEGAPAAPQNGDVSKADFANKIELSWDIPTRQSADLPYTWEITRMEPGKDESVILRFKSHDGAGGTNIEEFNAGDIEIKEESDRYTMIDSFELEPNVEYEYSIKAYCEVKDDDGVSQGTFPGPAVRLTGYLLSPPTDFEYSVNYDTKEMFITVGAPLGYNDSRNWHYKILAGHNTGTSSSSVSWNTLDRQPSVEESYSFEEVFSDSFKYNEFQFIVVNDEGEESNPSRTIAPDEIKANDFKIVANGIPDDGASANSAGIYPVVFTTTEEASGVMIEIEAARNSDGSDSVGTATISASDLVDGNNALPADISPSSLFTEYYFRARKTNPFGRTTSWSSWQRGWGGLTGSAYIDMFEMWILKPWEHLSELPDDLRSKWDPSNCTLSDKILNPSMDSQYADSMTSKYHGGKLEYSTANLQIGNITDLMNTSSVDVTFKYTNFGEHEDLAGTGTYTMYEAKNSGKGNGVSGNIRVTSSKYPAVVDFSNLDTNNKQFTGSYRLNQGGRGYENVPAN